MEKQAPAMCFLEAWSVAPWKVGFSYRFLITCIKKEGPEICLKAVFVPPLQPEKRLFVMVPLAVTRCCKIC